MKKKLIKFFDALSQAWCSEVSVSSKQEVGLIEFEAVAEALSVVKADVSTDRLQRALTGRVSEPVVNTILILSKKGAIGQLPSFVLHLKAVREKLGLGREAIVMSAQALEPSQSRALTNGLEKFFAMPVHLRERVEQGLVAGVRILSGDWLYDDTVAGRLKRLNDEFYAS